jgi:hypothetical protein
MHHVSCSEYVQIACDFGKGSTAFKTMVEQETSLMKEIHDAKNEIRSVIQRLEEKYAAITIQEVFENEEYLQCPICVQPVCSSSAYPLPNIINFSYCECHRQIHPTCLLRSGTVLHPKFLYISSGETAHHAIFFIDGAYYQIFWDSIYTTHISCIKISCPLCRNLILIALPVNGPMACQFKLHNLCHRELAQQLRRIEDACSRH